MSHRFPFPSGRNVLLPVTLLIILGPLTNCQKQDETPPPPKAPQAHRSSDGCQLAFATGLRGAMGCVVVHYPTAVTYFDARIHLYREGAQNRSEARFQRHLNLYERSIEHRFALYRNTVSRESLHMKYEEALR
jgi:hypothetical protein